MATLNLRYCQVLNLIPINVCTYSQLSKFDFVSIMSQDFFLKYNSVVK